jgi:hypothetical protein
VFGQPNITLQGQFASITNGILKIGGVDLNQVASDALNRAIDPANLVLQLPKPLLNLNPTVTSADFTTDNGQLATEASLTASVSPANIIALIQALSAAH